MTRTTDAFRAYANEHGLEVYQVPEGLGVRFGDGFDVFWILPEERWHFLNREPAAVDLHGFRELNDRRARVVDALRRYLAKQRVAVDLTENGHWSVMRDTCSSEFSVSANLTRVLANESYLVAAVRGAFEESFLRGPSERRAERHLSEFGQPLEEIPWRDEEDTLVSIPETPLAALRWMGLCKALKHESSFASREAFVAAVEPKGRIGEALLRVAQRLPNTRAWVELCDGSMCIEFSDEYDSFKIAPKSRELLRLLREMEPEEAGDRLADEYERIDAARRRVMGAVFDALNRHGYVMDSDEDEHVGRDVREFVLDLGESLTGALRQSGEECAIRQVLSGNDALADEAVSLLGRSPEDARLPERSLRPREPAAIVLPELAEERIAHLDERSALLLGKFMKTEDALDAYGNPLMWDANRDTWASGTQWQDLARRYVRGKHPRPNAEIILIDHGDTSIRDRFTKRLEESEPHDEVWDQEVAMVWQMRKEMPDLAAKWFGPRQHDDVPFAEARARLGDPIAVHHMLAGIVDDEDEPVPSVLAHIKPELVACFVDVSRINGWRRAASRWAEETWRWKCVGWGETLAVAANMGWPEIGDRLAENPFLLPGLLTTSEDDPGVMFADSMLLAWSKLAPSPFLMRLIGFVFGMDLERPSESLARRIVGSEDDFREYTELFEEHPKWVEEYARVVEEYPKISKRVSNGWLSKLSVALAICWYRCRRSVPRAGE